MPHSTPKTIHLKDYRPSAFLIATVELDIAIFDEHTRVTARLTMQRNPAAVDQRRRSCSMATR
jgi:aminopeptidase N